MLFQWNERTVRWLSDGGEYTGFYRLLAELLLPYISRRGSLCDIGCGLALTDFALAPYIGEITCADINGTALEYVRRRAAETGTENLSAVQADGAALSGCWDTVTAIFHGTVEEISRNYLEKAEDRLILVTHGPGAGARKQRADADMTALWLEENGFAYEKRLDALEFGQPFRSRADAADWAAAFRGRRTEAEAREWVLAGLQETGREDFPLYLPRRREFGIFILPRSENTRLLP